MQCSLSSLALTYGTLLHTSLEFQSPERHRKFGHDMSPTSGSAGAVVTQAFLH